MSRKNLQFAADITEKSCFGWGMMNFDFNTGNPGRVAP